MVLTIFVKLLRLLPKAFCSKSVVSHFRYWQFSELHAKSWKEYFESQYYLAKYTSFWNIKLNVLDISMTFYVGWYELHLDDAIKEWNLPPSSFLFVLQQRCWILFGIFPPPYSFELLDLFFLLWPNIIEFRLSTNSGIHLNKYIFPFLHTISSIKDWHIDWYYIWWVKPN